MTYTRENATALIGEFFTFMWSLLCSIFGEGWNEQSVQLPNTEFPVNTKYSWKRCHTIDDAIGWSVEERGSYFIACEGCPTWRSISKVSILGWCLRDRVNYLVQFWNRFLVIFWSFTWVSLLISENSLSIFGVRVLGRTGPAHIVFKLF